MVRGAAVAATVLLFGLAGCASDDSGDPVGSGAANGAGAGAEASASNGSADGTANGDGGAAEPDAEVPAIAGPTRDMCGGDMVAAMETAGYELLRRDDATGYCDFEHADGQLVLLMNDPLLQYEPIHSDSRLMSARDELDDGIRDTVWAVPDRATAMYSQCLAGETAGDGSMQYLLYTVFGGAAGDGTCREAANLYADVTGD